jgi:hypothetical protein
MIFPDYPGKYTSQPTRVIGTPLYTSGLFSLQSAAWYSLLPLETANNAALRPTAWVTD